MRPDDWAQYFHYSLAQLLDRTIEVTQELAGRHEALSISLINEAQDKIRGWETSTDSTVRGREKDADLNAIVATCAVMEEKGHIASLREERDLLLLLITNHASRTGT